MKRNKIFIIFLLLISTALPIQTYYYFGKNKVTYRKFNWKVLKTPHFDIYYDKDMHRIALEAARIAEEGSARLSRRYEHELTQIIPIVIYNSANDFMNNNITHEMIGEGTGGFTEFLRTRIVIPFTGRFETFHHVITHELSHAFQLNISFGSSSASSIGRMSQRTPPLWVMEGLAEHMTMGDEGEVNMYERDGILTGVMPTLPEMNMWYLLGQKYFYVYRGGQSFFNWMEKKYGKKKIASFYYKISKVNDPEIAFEEVLGKKTEEVSEEWFLYMKRKHWPKITEKNDPKHRDARFTEHYEDLSSFNLKPVFGKDDRYIYFVTDKEIYPKIVKYDKVQKKIIKEIVTAEKETAIESILILNQSLSFDSSRRNMLFLTRKGDVFYFNIYDVLKYKYIKKIKINFNAIFEINLSPDGNQIVFSGVESDKVDLYIYNIKENTYKQITDDDFSDLEPVWSPDGKKIIYSCNKDFSKYSFKRNLYIYDTETLKHLPFSVSDSVDSAPCWSPDGKMVSFTSERNGTADLYIKNLDNLNLHQVTEVIGGIGSSAWSYDNKKICYSGFHFGGYDVYVANVNMSNTNFIINTVVEDIDKGKMQSKDLSRLNEMDKYDFFFNTQRSTFSNYQPILFPDSMFVMFGLQSASGVGGWFRMSLSDMLNNHQVYIDTDISYINRNKIFDTDTYLEYLNQKKRLQKGVALRLYQQNYFVWFDDSLDIEDPDNWARVKRQAFQATGFLQYPFSKYKRVKLEVGPAYEGQVLVNHATNISNEYDAFGKPAIKLHLAYTHDNTLNGMLHPVDNGRSKFIVEGAVPLYKDVFLSYVKIIADYRKYFLIARRSSLALRAIWGGVWGGDKEVYEFRFGGSHPHPSRPKLRGYSSSTFRGNYMHLLNIEYRSRFLEQAIFAFPFRWGLPQINIVFFLDLGSAYSNINKYRFMHFEKRRMVFDDLYAGFGVGIRFIFLVFPIMLDFSTPWTGYSARRLKDWYTDLSIGFDF